MRKTTNCFSTQSLKKTEPYNVQCNGYSNYNTKCRRKLQYGLSQTNNDQNNVLPTNQANRLKQLNDLKARNYVTCQFNPLIDKPEIVNAIVQAIPKFTKGSNIFRAFQHKDSKKTSFKSDRLRKDLNSSNINSQTSCLYHQTDFTCDQDAIRKIKIAALTKNGRSEPQTAFSTPKVNQTPPFNYTCRQKLSKYAKSLKNYAISEQRRQILKIEEWFVQKLKTHGKDEQRGEAIITERMHIINRVYSEASVLAGHYSSQIKQLLDRAQQEYHTIYNYLFECLAKQNQSIKKQADASDQKLLTTIEKYQQLLLDMRTQHDKKCARVIQNFHRAVQQNKFHQTQLNFYKCIYENQKVKSQFIQTSLNNMMWVLLSLNPTQNSQKNLSKIGTEIPLKKQKDTPCKEISNRPQNYYKWCANLLNIATTLRQKTQVDKSALKKNFKENQLKKKNERHLYDVASKAIISFMVQNDASLSICDAKNLLKQFAPKKVAQTTQKNVQFYQKQQKKRVSCVEKLSKVKVPDLAQIYNKLSGVDQQVQVNFVTKRVSQQTQTVVLKNQIGTDPHKRFRNMGANTQQLQQNKLAIQRVLIEKIVNKQKNICKSSSKKIIISKKTIQQSNEQKLYLAKQKTISIKSKRSHHSKQPISVSKVNISLSRIPSVKQQRRQKRQPSIKKRTVMKYQKHQYSKQVSSSSSLSQKSQNLSISKNQILKGGKKVTIFVQPNKYDQYMTKNQIMGSKLSQDVSVNSNNCLNMMLNQQEEIIAINSFMALQKPRRRRMKSHKFLSKSFGSHSFEEQKQQKTREEENEGSTSQITKNKTIIEKDLQTIIKQGRLGSSQRSLRVAKEIQFATQQDAEKKQQLKCSIVQKRHTKKRLLESINRHTLHLQLFNRKQQSILSQILSYEQHSSNMKIIIKENIFSELKKMKTRLFTNKRMLQVNDKNMQALLRYSQQCIDPIIKSFTMLFQQNLQRERTDQLIVPQTLERLPEQGQFAYSYPNYYHKLVPLVYCIMKDKLQQNRANCSFKSQRELFGNSKPIPCPNNLDSRAFKIFRDFDPKFKVMDEVVKGGTAQLDILVKSLHYFDFYKNSKHESHKKSEIDVSTLQQALQQILYDYFQKSQIQIICEVIKIMTVRGQINESNLKRNYNFMSLLDILQPVDLQQEYITKSNKMHRSITKNTVNIFWVISKLLRAYKQKKSSIQRKYATIAEHYGKYNECISYQDIYYFLQVLPLNADHKRIILKKLSFYTVFWQKKEGSIPKDRLFFVLDMFRLISSSSDSNRNIIQEYIVNKAEFKFRNTLLNVRKYPQKIPQYVRKTLNMKKIPQILKRPMFLLVKNKNEQRLINSMITLIFHELFDSYNDVSCMPALFNGLLAIL